MPQLARSRPAVPVVPRRQLAPPAAPIRTPVGVVGDRPMVGTILALAIAVCAWLPWISVSSATPVGVVGSGEIKVYIDTWGVPASSLWSSTPSPGGVDLGFLILAVAVAVLAATWTRVIPRGGVRVIGVVGVGVPLLFLIQLQRSLARAAPGVGHFGLTDVTGFGVYLMAVMGLVVVLVPPGPSR
ncbi:MAG: hypothetical protein JJE46_12065 [Acidimicrobiia bacterium]|nr:hypothetical protein [Acidimicrobiia bacterium]